VGRRNRGKERPEVFRHGEFAGLVRFSSARPLRPLERRADKRAILRAGAEVAQALNTDERLVESQPVEHLIEKARLPAGDLQRE
jgi:hypothetical protein